jgi:glycosyltransferase involved in cell wall biosynthesis
MHKMHASYYYRQIVPLQTMERLGLPVEVIIDDCTPDVSMERRRDGLMWSDIVWMYQATDPLMRHNMQVIKKLKAQKGGDDKLWYPSSFVVDTDDNLFDVSPSNWAFKTLGVKKSDSEYLMPGGSVPARGDGRSEDYEWRDGENGFNITSNITRLEDYRSLCQTADAVTCSTPATERMVKREIGDDTRTFVNPNCVRFDHYQDLALMPHKGVRILWQGSNTHYDDLFFMKPALVRVAAKYPDAKFIFWGVQKGPVTDGIPDEQLEFIPWMDYDAYHLRLVTVAPDINLCPLLPTRFNDCRSGIKFYEGSLLHDPAATIAQRAGAYTSEIQHDKTGLLYDTEEEFEAHLCNLIENTQKRQELATNAKDWVHENRDAFKVVPKLYEFFNEIRANKQLTTQVEVDDAPVSEQQSDLRPSED